MRTTSMVLLGLALAFSTAASDRPGTAPQLGLREGSPGPRAFINAHLVVSPDTEYAAGVLVVEDGRVLAAGPNVTIPESATVHDLRGKHVYPGFLDPYTEYGLGHLGAIHPPSSGRTPRYESERAGATAWNDAIHAEREWVADFRPDADAARPLLERGVTVVQSVKRDGILRGRGFVASLRSGSPNEVLLRPRTAHFAAFDKGSSRQAYPGSLMGSIALLRQTLLDASWYATALEAVARNPQLPLPEVDRAVEALAGYSGAFVFETEEELSLLRAAGIAEEFSLPLIYVGSNFESGRLEEIAALARPVILPLGFPRAPEVGSFEDALDVSLADLRHWERAPHNAAALARAGVPIAFTGHGMAEGESFWPNLRRVVRRGLPRETALAALTVVPAELTGLREILGTLEPGKRADFVVTDGDPFTERARILSVWIAGRPVHEARSLEQADFRGSYRLELENRDYRLQIDERCDRLRGRVELGESRVRLRDPRPDLHELRFWFGSLPDDEAGATRVVLRERAEGWSARATLADGRRVEVGVTKTADRVPAETEPAAADEEAAGDRSSSCGEEDWSEADLALSSRRTLPDGAFGFETLPSPENLLVRNATLWTAEADGVLEEADLLIVDGRIAGVGRNLQAPPGVRVLDATGKHVTPGIIDEHSHLAIARGVNEGTHAVTAEVRIGDVIDSDDVGLYRALAGGVTAAQLLHGSANPIGGQAQVIKLRWGLPPEGLKFEGAPPSIKFALGENVKQSNRGDAYRTRYPQTRLGVETLMEDRFLAARTYEAEWRDRDSLPAGEQQRRLPPRRDLQLEATLEILNGRRFVHCHSYVQSEILMLMRLAERHGFRIQTFTHILEGYKVADEMARHGAGASAFSDWWAYKFEVYDAIPYNTCLLHDRGVVTSVNSDSDNVIRRLNQEAAKSVLYCGMDPAEALKLVTLNPAIQLRIDDRVGSLRLGKDADFAIWNGPPLSMYSKVEQTWVDGTLYFDLERDLALRQAAREERESLVQKVLRTRPQGGGPGRAAVKRTRSWTCEDVDDTWKERSGD